MYPTREPTTGRASSRVTAPLGQPPEPPERVYYSNVTGAWNKWSANLATSVERDFERKAMPFLHLFWPGLVQTPARSAWDAKGIDLLVWSDSDTIPCAVQCKGFTVQDIGDDQLRQTLDSIETFRHSGVKVVMYLVVHNRDGKNRKFAEAVEDNLRLLVRGGQARQAELWDRQKLLSRADAKLQETITAKVHGYSSRILAEFQARFKFGRLYKAFVPVTEKSLRFERFAPCKIAVVKPRKRRSINNLITFAPRVRWTLLAGRFGAGKTTSALHAAAGSTLAAMVVPCSALPAGVHDISSTNALLEQSMKALQLLDDLDPLDRDTIYEVGGTTMARLLRGPKPQYLLILDGLDENRLYSSLPGMQLLSNQLADLECPVVLTTRVEHLHAMFGDFSIAFEELSWRSSTKVAKLFELESWDNEDVRKFVLQVRNGTVGKERRLLDDLLDALKTSSARTLYGELPSNPLFLQFILEDVVSEGLRTSNRSELIDRWSRRKLMRDRSVSSRSSMNNRMDTLEFVERMLRLMELVASRMTATEDSAINLVESISSDAVVEEARGLFGREIEVLPIVLNSLLMPVGPRAQDLQITFAFRVLHEYFLARHITSERIPDSTYPNSVRSFVSEMKLQSH